jgi:syntaxin 5
MADRTNEFRRLVDQFGTSVVAAASAKGMASSSSKKSLDIPSNRSQFNDAASEIARGIHRTSQVLTKLTKLVRNQGLFDDPTEEINSLVHRIKQDIGDLNSKCDSAQQYVDNRKRSLGDHNQLATHSVNVVSQLKSDLMCATKGFKDVLELRSSKMKDQQERKMKITGSSILSPIKTLGAGGSNGQHANGKTGKAINNTPYAAAAEQDMEAGYSDGNGRNHDQEQRQLLLAPPVDLQYYESREKAVTEVEKTIRELGQLFQRLGTMISQQQELIERIDDDIESSVADTERAKGVLQKAYEQVSSNSGLYTKIFFIFAIFALFFLLFLM